MGDLSKDTALSGSDGEYTAQISPDWRIWGPNGGYLAAIALRGASRDSAFQTPASFFCHFLSVGRFDEARVIAEPIRRGRSADSIRARLLQGEKALIEAMVWLTDPAPGLLHDDAPMPEVDSVVFHRPAHGDWLLGDSHAPVAADGRTAAVTQVWDEAGRLTASGTATLLMRPRPDSVS